MLGIDPRTARIAWTVFLVALVIAAAYAVRETLVVFVIALFFGYLLMPMVDLVARFTPRRITFSVSLAIVYLFLVGAILGLAITVGSRLVEEANNLATRLPDLLSNRQWIQQLPLPGWLEPVRDRINQALQGEINSGGKDILPYVKSLGGQLLSGAKYVIYIVLVPILAFFFLKDGRGIQQEIVSSLADESRRPVLEDILRDIDRLLGEYIRALVLLAVASFAVNTLFFAITGAPYMILLAVLSALGEFLPVVGPAGAGVIVLVVTGLAGYSHLLLYVVFFIVFRMTQDYVLSPYLMGKGVKLNPVLVLFGVLAGEQIGGVLGMFFSVPVIATLRVLFVRLRRTRIRDLVTADRDL